MTNFLPECSVNSILFQRQIYEAKDFERVNKLGLVLFETTNPRLKASLKIAMDGITGKPELFLSFLWL
jgi:hypothetical protein